MFTITEIGCLIPVAMFETFEAAVEYAKTKFPVVHFELDADYPEAADFLTKFGTVYAIQAL